MLGQMRNNPYATDWPQGVQHQGGMPPQLQQQRPPDWYRQIAQLGRQQYLDNNAPADGWKSVIGTGAMQDAKRQFESQYGGYNGDQMPQGLMGLATQNLAGNNYFQKAGMNPAQATPMAQNYLSSIMQNGGNGGNGSFSPGGLSRFFGGLGGDGGNRNNQQTQPQPQPMPVLGAAPQNYGYGLGDLSTSPGNYGLGMLGRPYG